MAESAVNTVLGSVGNLAVQEIKLLWGVSLEVRSLKDELMRLQAYLKDADEKGRSGNAIVANLVRQIRSAAYEAQNVIEAADYMEKRNRLKKGFIGAISRYAHLPSDLATLHTLDAEIRRIKRKLREIFESAVIQIPDLPDPPIVVTQQDFSVMHHPEDDDIVMVGFEDEHKEIVDKLVDSENMLSVVSIIAMGGAGKTTLATKVYTSSRVKEHFETVAWVTVSQSFKGIDLLKSIMKQIIGVKDESRDESIDEMNEYEVGRKIRHFLLQKRYLVVLDDLWEEDTWDQINRAVVAFPNANNGSRVLLTTRKEKVANHVEMPTHVHALKNLDEEKSWKLFCSKALPSYRRVDIGDAVEFEELGRKLAKKCDGLPLALAVLGGYLSKNLTIQAWSAILPCWPSTGKTSMMREILARSYKDVTDHYLRSCFLYLATFPEDHIIDVSMLISLWIAEGFIPHARKHEPEEIARNYVEELAQRSLVQVTSRSKAHGWIEKIRVHDILRDWCIEEAREDGFLDVIESTSDLVGASSTGIMTSYRSSYQGFSGSSLNASPNLRALIGFQLPPISLPKLRFLRVLHIENSRVRDFSTAIGGCLHLRCIRFINCDDLTLPSSIGKLIYLQTIDMRRTHCVVPQSMWDILSLRHVYLSGWFSPPRIVQPNELQTLSLDLSGWFSPPRSTEASDRNLQMIRFLGQMTQLRTLSFETHASMPVDMMNIFANMPRLVDVELRQVSALYKLPDSHHFSQILRSFDLSIDAITKDPMPVLEKFPCLVVLKLYGYRGLTMSCSAQGFPRLQRLHLFGFVDTVEWKIEVGAMPKLSSMTLSRFRGMSKLSEGWLHLPSLNQVELIEMGGDSVRGDATLKELQQKGCKVIKN
ncbi:unnamed protein product [Alopecurus aequalis]